MHDFFTTSTSDDHTVRGIVKHSILAETGALPCEHTFQHMLSTTESTIRQRLPSTIQPPPSHESQPQFAYSKWMGLPIVRIFIINTPNANMQLSTLCSLTLQLTMSL